MSTPPRTQQAELGRLATEIMEAHKGIVGAGRTALDHARRAGVALQTVKDLLKHGDWLPWLAKNVDISPRMVQVYMDIARHGPELGARPSNRRIGHRPSNILVESAAPPMREAMAGVRRCRPGRAPRVGAATRLSAKAIQLQDVVRRAHQRPFRLYLCQTSQQKGSEAARVFDLPDHRFDDRFAPSVDGRAGLRE